MKTSEFLNLIDEIVEASPGTVQPDQDLTELQGWDSLALVSFVAVINERFGMTLRADRVTKARSIPDLLALVRGHIEP
jgi:acyl carrier protein